MSKAAKRKAHLEARRLTPAAPRAPTTTAAPIGNPVVDRCTRGGATSWQQVAKQLGRSVDSVRAQFDPTYLRAHVWAPTRGPEPDMATPTVEPDPEALPDAEAYRSPHSAGPGLKALILTALDRCPASAETIATRISRTPESVRVRLSCLKADGLVVHDERPPYTWVITDAGRSLLTRLAIEGRKVA